MDPGDFKAYVFPVMFFKWISDNWAYRHAQAVAEWGDELTPQIEYADYQCPYCARWTHESLPELREYVERGELRIEWRDVNVYGEDSERAARAALAAAMQGRHTEYQQDLFDDGEIRSSAQLDEQALIALAEERGFGPGTKATPIVEWLAAEHGLGRGHAMALVHVITKGPQISAKHVDSGGTHSDPSDTLWLDGAATNPATSAG